MLNKLLLRQVQKHLGRTEELPDEIAALLKVISESYDHYEKDRKMLERCIDLSSTEMIELNNKLREETIEVKKAHHELDRIFNNIEEVLYSVDMVSYKLIKMSAACEKVYGYTPEEFLADADLWQNFIHPDDKHIVKKHLNDLFEGKQVFNQYRIIHKDGTIRWVDNKIIPTLDENGRLIRLDGLTIDATEKINNEQKLKESEIRFRSLIENSADMLTMVDAVGNVIYESPAITKTLGYTPGENIGRSGFDLIHPDDLQKAVEVFGSIVENPGTPISLTARMKTKNGNYIFAEGHITNLLHLKGINSIVSNFRDVTERVEAERNLEESQKRYRLVYENPFLGIALGTIDGKIQNANQAFSDMLGYSQKELFGKHFSEFSLPEDVKRESSFITRMSEGEIDNYQLEKRYITKSGEIIWAELSISCAKNESGKIQFVIAVVQDITSRKKAEESLLESEANLRNILENTDTSYILLDEHANILSFNKLAQDLAREELHQELEEGKNYIDLMLEERRADVKNTIKNILEKREQLSYEINYPHQDRTDKWLSVSMHPIFSPANKVLGLSIAATDITNRKKSEQLIKLSNERYELVTKATNDVIWDWDMLNNKIFRSENYKQVFGYYGSGDNIYTQSNDTYIHPDDSERILNSIAKKIKEGNATLWEDQYRYYRSNGELAYVQDRGYIIYDENKKPVRMVGAMHDITSEKLFAIERDKITSDLIRQNKDLEQYAYIVSHNLRGPLANIIGLSQIIQSEKADSLTYKIGLEGLNTSVKNLDNVIMDLGRILQIKRGINEKKEYVFFSDLVNDIKTSIYDSIEKEEVIIQTDFSGGNQIFTLKSYMHSIFYNLISNSIKYSKAGEKIIIEISSKESESDLTLTFKDNGQGIDLVTNGNKVFGLYKRFHNNVEGKGMGLFMVKTQVETLGGKINIKSEVNKGTEFLIQFDKEVASTLLRTPLPNF